MNGHTHATHEHASMARTCIGDLGDGRLGAGRRQRVRGRADRRRRRRSPPARSCSTPRCPATRRSSPTRATPVRSSRSRTRTSATTASTPPTSSRARLFCRGVVVRELARRHSNHRAEADLDAMLVRHGIPGIAGIDTRRLTRLIRDTGAIPGAFGAGRRSSPTCVAAARAEPGTDGVDLVAPVTTPDAVHGRRRPAGRRRSSPTTSGSSARSCATSPGSARSRSCRPSTPAADVLARDPDGVFLSQRSRRPGRWSPDATDDPRRAARHRSRSSGSASATSCSAGRSAATTVKLPFGHHGANHPVKDLHDGRDRDHQPEPQLRRRRTTRWPAVADLTHVNLNDGVCEGLEARDGERASACSTTPRPAPARTTAATCSTSSPSSWRYRGARRRVRRIRRRHEPAACRPATGVA